MWALVKANQVIKIFNTPQAFEHKDIKHPANIFSSWSAEEKAAIGIYPVQEDRSNVKDEMIIAVINERCVLNLLYP